MTKTLNRLLRNRLTLPIRPFYRQYPYRGGISVKSADSRGCVDTELGFFYSRIPKAANSTITSSLARIKFGRDLAPNKAKRVFRYPSQLSRPEVARIDSLFRFTVVRNPYTRTLSAYLDKIKRRFDQGRKVESSFAEFLDALANGRLYANAHWAPQSSLLLLPLEDFDFIGKVETLTDDLAHIHNRILRVEGLEREPVTSVLSHATGATDKLNSYYDEANIETVRTLYRQDFELLGYSPEFPGVAKPASTDTPLTSRA